MRAIRLATWTTTVSPGPPPEPTEPLLDAETFRDVLVAEHDGALRGYVRVSRAGSLPSQAHVRVINGLVVDPERQGSGVGRRLIEAAVEEAERRGARKVTLRVLATNTRARALYESCGFVVEGTLRGEFVLNGEYVDDLLMAREVDSLRIRQTASAGGAAAQGHRVDCSGRRGQPGDGRGERPPHLPPGPGDHETHEGPLTSPTGTNRPGRGT